MWLDLLLSLSEGSVTSSYSSTISPVMFGWLFYQERVKFSQSSRIIKPMSKSKLGSLFVVFVRTMEESLLQENLLISFRSLVSGKRLLLQDVLNRMVCLRG